jgi:hypothetical protein
MPLEDLIDSGGSADGDEQEPHGNLRRLVADWQLIAPLG